MAYEDFLIREATGEYQSGDTNCSDCGQEICACESLAEWLTERDAEVCSTGSGEDVCVFPALPEPTPLDFEHFGSESEPYTHEEVNIRRKETHICE